LAGTHYAEIGQPVELRAPEPPALPATLSEFVYLVDDEGGVSVRMTLDVGLEQWARIDRDQLFHLAPDVRGPEAQSFSPGGPVHIELELDSRLVPQLYGLSREPLSAGQQLAGLASTAPASPLLATDSWYALRVLADVALPPGMDGQLRSGFSTSWAQAADQAGGPAAATSLGLPMLAVVEEVLEQRGWDHRPIPQREAIGWRVHSAAGAWESYAIADEQPGLLLLYSILEVSVPDERRPAAAMLIARLNQGLPVGNWELDLASGSLRYKTSLDLGAEQLTLALCDRLLERNMDTVAAHVAALEGFAAGRLDMAAALAAAGEPLAS
jgi:hypothetical protein